MKMAPQVDTASDPIPAAPVLVRSTLRLDVLLTSKMILDGPGRRFTLDF
jgi:hypothetical protein